MKTKLIVKSLLGASSAIILLLSSTLGHSTELPFFSASDYGKTVLPINQSLGDAATIIRKQGNIFEPLSQLRRDDPLRVRARAIGRLDLVIETNKKRSLITCTASIVKNDTLLTNHHCIPGTNGLIIKASLVLDYELADGTGATRLKVDPTPLESNAELDYALVRILEPIPHDIKPLALAPLQVKPRQQLLLIHHPAGQVKKMSRFRCRAAANMQENTSDLRHICESLPGSSGGILFNTSTGAVGLHHSGGLDKNDPDSFNKGTLLTRLMDASQILRSVPLNKTEDITRPEDLTGDDQQAGQQKSNKTNQSQKNRGNSSNINDILTQP